MVSGSQLGLRGLNVFVVGFGCESCRHHFVNGRSAADPLQKSTDRIEQFGAAAEVRPDLVDDHRGLSDVPALGRFHRVFDLHHDVSVAPFILLWPGPEHALVGGIEGIIRCCPIW